MSVHVCTAELAQRQPPGVLPSQPVADGLRNYFLELADHALGGQYFEDARDILQGLAVLDRDHPVVWAMLGRAEKGLGSMQDAREAFALAVSLDPQDTESVVELCEVHEALGDHRQSEAIAMQLGSRVALSDDHLRRLGNILEHHTVRNGAIK